MENPKLADAVAIKKKSGKFTVIHPDIPIWFAIPKEGARALELCDGSRRTGEIIEIVAREFNAPADDVEKGITSLLDYCEKKGFFTNIAPKKPDVTPKELSILYLNITRKCNLKCVYCYASAGTPFDGELSLDEIKGVLDDFKALGKGLRQNVIISGGEPLTRSDFWEIVEYAKSLGLILVLSSNGLLIDKATAKKLRMHFGGVQISLDGDREMHEKHRGKGSYDGAMRGITNLIEAGLTPSISATITKENFKSLNNIWDVCDKYKLKHVKTNPILPFGRAKDKKDEMMLTDDEYLALWRDTKRQLKKRGSKVIVDNERSLFSGGTAFKGSGHSCGAGRSSLSVESDGNVYPCQAAHLPQFICGNIKEKTLDEIRSNAAVLRDWMSRSIHNIPKCNACEWKMYCGGGCYVQAALEHGTVHAPDLYCSVYKVEYEETFWEYVDEMLRNKEESNES